VGLKHRTFGAFGRQMAIFFPEVGTDVQLSSVGYLT
jgi:hypothetical protein